MLGACDRVVSGHLKPVGRADGSDEVWSVPSPSVLKRRAVYEVLVQRVLPELVNNLPHGEELRVWCPQATSPADVVSMALACDEAVSRWRPGIAFRVFLTSQGTPVHPKAQHDALLRNLEMPPELLRQHFGGGEPSESPLYARIEVTTHDLDQAAPLEKVHLLDLRGAFAVRDDIEQRELANRLRRSLADGGGFLLDDGHGISLDGMCCEEHRDAQLWREASAPERWPRVVEAPTALHHTLAARFEDRLLQQYAPPSVLVDREHRVVHVSGETRGLLGWPKEPTSDSLVRLLPDELGGVVLSLLRRAFREKRTVSALGVTDPRGRGTLRVVVRNGGSPEHCAVSFEAESPVHSVPNSGPQARHVERGFRDNIAELQAFNRELREQHSLVLKELESSQGHSPMPSRVGEGITGLLHAVPEAAAIVDTSGIVRVGNARWDELVQAFEEQDVNFGIGANYFDALEASALLGSRTEAALSALRKGEEVALEYECGAHGQPRFFQLRGRPFQIQAKGPRSGHLIVHEGICSKVSAEQERDRLRRQNESLLGCVSAPVLRVESGSLRVLAANEAVERLLQRPGDALVGASLRMLTPEERWAEWLEAIEGARRGERFSGELPVWVGSGRWTPRPAALAAAGDGEFWVSFGVAPENDAERSQRTQRLEALGALAGGVAHELNNVLAAILAVASSWGEEPPRDEWARDVQDIIAACGRGREVTRSLLSFASNDPEPGRPVCLNDVVEEVMSLISRTSPSGVRVVVQLPPEDVVVHGRRGQLGQALMNIVLNALDAVGSDGVIRVCLAEEPDAENLACIEVVDDGVGMDDATLKRVFEPFFTTKGRDKGTGLGLPMVYGLARSSGGSVVLDSSPGQGTTVRLFLPQVTGAPATKLRGFSEAPAARGKVLVVDDDPLARRSTRRLLERFGMEVEEASGGGEAMATFRNQQAGISAVILDVVMPGEDGISVLGKIRDLDVAVPVVLYSGYPDTAEEWHDRVCGATAFVQKPDPERMLQELKRLMMAG